MHFAFCIWFARIVVHVAAQGCSPTCSSSNGDLCVGDTVPTMELNRNYTVCHPEDSQTQRFNMYVPKTTDGAANIIVLANYYMGCNAGRREAGVFSAIARNTHARFPNVRFFVSLKGGTACVRWAEDYQDLGARLTSDTSVPQPYTISDEDYIMRDAFFTSPYPHPSYVIIGPNGVITHKFVGPCCGYEHYYSCGDDVADTLVETMNASITKALDDYRNRDCVTSEWTEWSPCTCVGGVGGSTMQNRSRAILESAGGNGTCPQLQEGLQQSQTCSENLCIVRNCSMTAWGNWSVCSQNCGGGVRYRVRNVSEGPLLGGTPCPQSVEFASCENVTECSQRCVPGLGRNRTVTVVASGADGLQAPRDLAFSPHPGRHLGNFSSGRQFPTQGEELWVANSFGHSVTIVTGIGTDSTAALTRRDRGYFHYMHNITGISFNTVPPSQSQRTSDKDTYGFVATCQFSNNTYLGLKDPNYFQGPTMYDPNPNPSLRNLVARDGSACTPGDECFFLHVDMLHESPTCSGIVHDPEVRTAYGAVYWAIDGWRKHLVRYDFQQPHGAGFMDHSVAAIRRYPEVRISVNGQHQGMVVHAAQRRLYIVDPGERRGRGRIIYVNMDTGKYARTAREEYPPFSSRLPSFEYSIYECVEHGVFRSRLVEPRGLALDPTGTHLYVANVLSRGMILVFDIATAELISSMSLPGRRGLSGLAFSPSSQSLFGVDAEAHELLNIQVSTMDACDPTQDDMSPIVNPSYAPPPADPFAVGSNGTACEVVSTIPNETLFEQVHVARTGYGDDRNEVQNDSMMDTSAILLANRTDCEANSSLNFDALLLGGYFCHTCLPESCSNGGVCSNVQWLGYTCDNEFFVTRSAATNWEYALGFAPNHPNRSRFNADQITLVPGRSYEFIINSPGASVVVQDSSGNTLGGPIEQGRLTINVDQQSLAQGISLASANQAWRMNLGSTTTTTTAMAEMETSTTIAGTTTTGTNTMTSLTGDPESLTNGAPSQVSGATAGFTAAVLTMLTWIRCE